MDPDSAQVAKSLYLPEVIDKSGKLLSGRPPVSAFVAGSRDVACLRQSLADLALPNAQVLRGGIGKAIKSLSTTRSPKILIVDISNVDLAASRMFELLGVCEPETTVIAIGETNDVGLYRNLITVGVADYIVKPVTTELLSNALCLARAEVRSAAISKKLGRMVAFAGARGGVGATTLAVNLAWYLAHRLRRRVALVDFDLHRGDCAAALNLRPTPGLREALTNPHRLDALFLERTMARYDDALFVFSCEETMHEEIRPTAEGVNALLAALRSQFHYVVVDIPRLVSAPYRQAFDTASQRIIVADHTLPSIRDTVRMRNALNGTTSAHSTLVVINRSGEGGRSAPPLRDIEAHLGIHPQIVVPFLPRPFASASLSGRPLAARPGRFARVTAKLAAEITGRPPAPHHWWWRFAA